MAEPNVPDLTILMLDTLERDYLDKLLVTQAATSEGANKKFAIELWSRLSTDTVAP